MLNVTENEKRIARLQAAELDSLYRSGDVFIRKYTKAIERAAIAAVREDARLGEVDLKSAEDEMVGFGAWCYLTGLEAFERQREQSLTLSSSFDKRVNAFADSFEINVGNLNRQIRTLVGAKTRGSLSNVRDRINEALADISKRQVPTRTGIKLLQTELRNMGFAASNPVYVETLVRTHAQLTYNAAQWSQLADDQDVWGFKYVTVGDNRVRPEHVRLEGITRKRDDPVWNYIWPPNGWNCRCQCLALYDSRRQTTLPRNLIDLIDEEFQFNPGMEFESYVKPKKREKSFCLKMDFWVIKVRGKEWQRLEILTIG